MKLNNKIIFFSILISLFFILLSCDSYLNQDCKESDMPSQTSGTGEINPYINVISKIIPATSDDIIVSSDSLNIYGLMVTDRLLPSAYYEIDFSKFSVLGKKVSSGGCAVRYLRHVAKDVNAKKYIFIITILKCGYCKEYHQHMNWVLIPKMEDGYTLETHVQERQF